MTYVYNKDGAADAALSQTDASIRSLIKAYATNKTDPGVFDVSLNDGAGFVSRAVSPGSAVLTVSGTRYNALRGKSDLQGFPRDILW
ncbi:MAG TPA: hypothetical protein IAB18_01985 [Candidatus Avisuccinivibrio pullicola]|nr:hypothetical protein [Candidatus Avisuccinivibrio pullicola]